MSQEVAAGHRARDEDKPREQLLREIKALRGEVERLGRDARKAEEERDRARMLLNVLPSPVWRAGADGKCDYFNESWLEFTGRALEQELGDGWAEGIHPDDAGRVMAEYHDAVRERRPFTLEYRLRRKDGRYHHVIDVGKPFLDRHGNHGGYIGSVFDIDERVGTEEALRKAANDLKERVKELSTLYHLTDLYQRPGRVPDILAEAVALLPLAYQYPDVAAARIRAGGGEYSTANFRDTPWKQAATFGTDGGVEGTIEVVYLDERPREYEGPFLEEERALLDSIAKLTESFIDRRLSEDTLKQNYNFIRTMMDTIPVPIFYKDARGMYIGCNATFEKVLGVAMEDIKGKTVFELFPEALAAAYDRADRTLLREHKPQVYESKVIFSDGQEHEVVFYKAPFFDADGKPGGLIGTMMDITERKRIQKELEDAKAQAELYLDLISHDINNMNQVGIGYLELALGTLPLGEDDRELLNKPLEALRNSSGLIDNIRKLQKARSGEFKRRPTDLCSMLQEMQSMYTNIRGKDVTVHFTPVEHCMVIANDLIRDVFSNLIENSIKHSDPGRPLQIGIGLSSVRKGGRDHYVVVVEDDGPGIPDPTKRRLFQKFQRGVTKASGKGLGLYLVRMLVEDFGGSVWVEDRVPGEYAKGTRFVVKLPAARES